MAVASMHAPGLRSPASAAARAAGAVKELVARRARVNFLYGGSSDA
jgi:hypothetical protein